MAQFVAGVGDLLEADVDALTNTVNTVGVMGKGIALAFKGAFPENFEAYRTACERGEVKLGEMFVFENRRDDGFTQLKLLEEYSGREESSRTTGCAKDRVGSSTSRRSAIGALGHGWLMSSPVWTTSTM